MEQFKVRIDTDDVEKVVQFLEKYSTEYLLGLEDVLQNPHVHIYIRTIHKPQTLRNRIRLDFGKGNGSYSLTKVKETEEYPMTYLKYCIKQKRVKFSLKDITLKDIEDHITEQEKYKAKNSTTWKDIYDWIEEHIDTPEYRLSTLYSLPNKVEDMTKFNIPKQYSLQHYKMLVCKYYMVHDKLIRLHQVVSTAQTIYLKKYPDRILDILK